MPKAYVIFQEQINDPDAMNAYTAKAMPTFGPGMTLGAVETSAEVLEGEWHGNQTVILEFESVEAAKAWYDSPEYQEAIPLRQAAANCNAVIIKGFGA